MGHDGSTGTVTGTCNCTVASEKAIIIVDENTGRLMPGRRWGDGLHQAVEAKENVAVQEESKTFATITMQNYFRMYDKLGGMTGTAEMMKPFAKSILPEGWNLLTPEASFTHLKRGFTWWRYEKEDEPRKRLLSSKELADVDASLHELSNQMGF